MALLQFTNLNKYGDKRTRIIYNPTTSIGFNPSGFGSFIGIRVFKYKYKHPIMPPGLVQLGGKKYIVPTWQEVLPKTTLNDIEWIKPKIKKQNKSKSKTWKFESSSSDLTYTVKQVDSDTLRCNCPGFYRAKDRNLGCKHVQKVRESLTK